VFQLVVSSSTPRCHLPLLGGYDEPETLSYQITLFGPIGADVRQMSDVFNLDNHERARDRSVLDELENSILSTSTLRSL